VQDSPVVRFVPEDAGSASADFDFSGLPVSAALQLALAMAFAARTRPGGPIRARESAAQTFRTLRMFATYLSTLVRPPRNPSDLTPAHLNGWLLQRQHQVDGRRWDLKASLRRVPGITNDFAACVAERNPARQKAKIFTYSRSEFTLILNTARGEIRRTVERIRANRTLLRQWRVGELDHRRGDETWLRGKLLDFVDTHDDVPRYTNQWRGPLEWVAVLGTVEEHITALHLSPREAMAFVVLLVGLTGQNRGTIGNAPAAHHRPDGYGGGTPAAVVELDKPRRGRRRHMEYAMVGLPQWTAAATGDVQGTTSIDLRSPFGVYMLLHELAEHARQRLGSDRLLAWWAMAGGSAGGGLRSGLGSLQASHWGRQHNLTGDPPPDGGPPRQLEVSLRRLRLTFSELHQRPVAHTEATLVNEYLVRNRGNIAEYQQVVGDALAQQVAKVTTHERIATLSPEDVAEAAEHPAHVAARHGMDTQTLQRLLAGRLDTVVGGCVDNTHGPHTPGQACRASFMLCLSCPCARATPQHLPTQALVHDELEARRVAMTPLRWTQRFALPHAQLADLLDRAGPVAVADARVAVTAADRQLVDRFLHRELDLI
jgi:hypothetical protein